uniref:Serine incorporator n=1 Tax=Oryza barthii TaxID=65489 RepID=A0A0D3EKB5_9ORYZ
MHGQGHKSNERPRRAFVERDGRRCQVGHSRQVNSRAFFLLLASFACLLWLRREQKKKKKEAHRAAARHLHLHSSSSTLAISHICDARQNKTLLPSRQWRPLKLPPALLPLHLRRSSIPAVACRIRSIRGGGVRSWGSMTLGSGGMAAEEGGGNGEAAARGERCVVVAVEETCCACAQLVVGPPNPMMARYVYAFVFLATNLLAWTLRDFGHPVLAELRRLRGSCQGAGYCLGAEGVLRVSLGCFTHDRRNSWHSEWWPAKIVLWMGFTVVPFFLPSPLIQLYGKIAHFGAGAFLVIQLVSVTRFITWLNDCCRSETNLKRCHMQVQVVSIAAYVGSILGVVLMYVWYAPRPSCKLNILFITVTLVLVQLMTGVSLSSKVKAGYLAPGLMGVYIVFLCWTAIRSEPHTEICNKKAEVATSADWVNIASFVIAVIVIVTATFATGIDSKCLQFKKAESEQPEDDDIPYGFGFFHFVFAMGAMYFAMLFVGWNANQTMEKWTIDVGWASTWVRGGQVGSSPEGT